MKNCLMKQKNINEFATRREVEKLYRAFKSDNSSFKDEKPSNKCDQSELINYFYISSWTFHK